MECADITTRTKSKVIIICNSAPEWRIIKKKGLCLEGICYNKYCKAF